MPGSLTPLDITAIQIPHHFRCPISLELMQDPVTVSSGQTFDRQSIEDWFATGNATCPVTRSPLSDFSLIPNHTLRRLIQSWCVVFGVDRIPTPKQPADPTSVRVLLSQSLLGPDRISPLKRLRSLARESDKNRSVIFTHETRTSLISIAFEDLRNSNSDLQLESMAILSMSQFTEKESLLITTRPERLDYLSKIMVSNYYIENRINAAAVLESAVAASRSMEVKSVIGSMKSVISTYVSLISQKENTRGMKIGVRGLFTLCLCKENRVTAIESNAAEALIRVIQKCDLKNEILERALATIELICRVGGGREAILEIGDREVVRALVKAMEGKATERAAEHAAAALAAVLGSDECLQKAAVEEGVVTWLIMMVQSGCTERGKRKAQVLLKMVRWVLVLEESGLSGLGFGSDDCYYVRRHY